MHDRGTVLTHAMLMLAGGGAACSEIEFLASQQRLLGAVASDSTTGNATVVLDIDASLIQIHSENKAGTGPNCKGGFGFHPLLCFEDATGEALGDAATGQRRREHAG